MCKGEDRLSKGIVLSVQKCGRVRKANVVVETSVIRTDLLYFFATSRHVERYTRRENGAEYDLRSLARALPGREVCEDIRTRAKVTENTRVKDKPRPASG